MTGRLRPKKWAKTVAKWARSESVTKIECFFTNEIHQMEKKWSTKCFFTNASSQNKMGYLEEAKKSQIVKETKNKPNYGRKKKGSVTGRFWPKNRAKTVTKSSG